MQHYCVYIKTEHLSLTHLPPTHHIFNINITLCSWSEKYSSPECEITILFSFSVTMFILHLYLPTLWWIVWVWLFWNRSQCKLYVLLSLQLASVLTHNISTNSIWWVNTSSSPACLLWCLECEVNMQEHQTSVLQSLIWFAVIQCWLQAQNPVQFVPKNFLGNIISNKSRPQSFFSVHLP